MEKFSPHRPQQAQQTIKHGFSLCLARPRRFVFGFLQLLLACGAGLAQQPVLTRNEAVQLALAQASNFRQAQFTEQLAAEDVKQARAALRPVVTANPSVIYTSPSLARQPSGTPRPPSYLGANAITEYQALVTLSGEWDTSGRLKAALRRTEALLQAAQAGTETARRTLAEATDEAYYGLALATARRQAAELNLTTATDFEHLTRLLLDGGEVAPLDLKRAELQSNTRRDELAQAQASEKAAADALRALLGYNFTQPVATLDLLMALPEDAELSKFTADAISARPELAQLLAEQRAAAADVTAALSVRRPQVTYAFDGGFISDRLTPAGIGSSNGVRATVAVSLPLFDSGAGKSRLRQAEIRARSAKAARVLAQIQFAQQFSTALAQAESAAGRIRLVSQTVSDAGRILEVSIARYRAGEAPISEVTDAQNQVAAQRGALYQAVYDYQIAKARLRQATGQ